MFASKTAFQKDFKKRVRTMFGIDLADASKTEMYSAVASMVREAISEAWVSTNSRYLKKRAKQVYYFSLEFLVGRFLEQNLAYIGALDVCRDGLAGLGLSFDDIAAQEPDAGLGNGGLGRLAACFLDSMASLSIPGHGCGIRYKYGLFSQKLMDGYQVELPDNWLRQSNAWEIRKPEKSVVVKFGGDVKVYEEEGRTVVKHENYQPVVAVPYDTPIIGDGGATVNTLRLWSAETASNDFDFESFSKGFHTAAISYKYSVEAISEVLYPDDSNYVNKQLRLKQQYFFVSAGLMSIVRRYKMKIRSLNEIPDYIVVHINDTHPAVAVAELMRILMDEEGFGWDEAWDITTRTIAYTNHTIMPEALETWPVDTFKELLPRIWTIVEEINRRFCLQLMDAYPGDWDRVSEMAIVSDGQVRMAHLAVAGSFSVNGVAAVHTELLKHDVLKRFYEHWPDKFNNKTNGITHRRWLLKANPKCARLITDTVKGDWTKDTALMAGLAKSKSSKAVQDRLERIKRENKERLADYIKAQSGVLVDTGSIFDVQVKRVHAYKRQLLNLLHIMHLYNEILDDPGVDMAPRTFIIGGKAAPSYYFAKSVIKLATSVASIVNADARARDRLKVFYLENYCVSLAEIVFPASDVSEQISTASKEASGTGNMKFMMNGAVTIGTMDGANIEIHEKVGDENFVSFGLTVDEVLEYYRNGKYSARDVYMADERLRRVVDQLTDGFFAAVPRDEFEGIRRSLLDYNDEFFVLKDFDSYVAAQKQIDELYRDRRKWLAMSAANIAHSGAFSSDNTIREYASGIWKVAPLV